jgi:hypothetical protein
MDDMLDNWRGANSNDLSNSQRQGMPSLDAQGAEFGLSTIFGT